MPYRVLRPVLFMLDPERAHDLVQRGARAAQALCRPLVRGIAAARHPALGQTVFGLFFENPVGLAAGLDKNARLFRFFSDLGFGFVEVGSVSALPWPGNPRPRLFRLPADRALVNRMGLNNDGAEAVAARIARDLRGMRVPLGISLVKTPDPSVLGDEALRDFERSYARLAPLASYVALNISCPNTSDGRTFAEPEPLSRLLSALSAHRRRTAPLLLKLPPPPASSPLDEGLLDEVLAVAREQGVSGLIATNTCTDRAGLATDEQELSRIGAGGLSGRPLAARATQMVRTLFRKTGGSLPIIGVGGIDSAEAAYEKIRAGARLIQLYTGLVYEGPGLPGRINVGLLRLLERDGLASIAEAVGLDA